MSQTLSQECLCMNRLTLQLRMGHWDRFGLCDISSTSSAQFRACAYIGTWRTMFGFGFGGLHRQPAAQTHSELI